MATKQYGSVNLAERVSAVYRDVLYYGSPWAPGETFSNEAFIDGVGVYYVNKLTQSDAAIAAPGADYDRTDASTDQVKVDVNQAFPKSFKLTKAQSKQVENQAIQAKLAEDLLKKMRQGFQTAMTAKIVAEGTVATSTTTIDENSVKAEINKLIVELNEAKVFPDFIVVSPATLGAMRLFSGKEFTPELNSDVMRSGNVGTFLGLKVRLDNRLGTAIVAKYNDATDTAQTVDLSKVECIVGHYGDISGGAAIEDAEIVKDPNSNSMLVNGELIGAVKVLDTPRVLIKKRA